MSPKDNRTKKNNNKSIKKQLYLKTKQTDAKWFGFLIKLIETGNMHLT